MSNKNTFWWIALAFWAFGSTWWHTCRIKELCDAPIIQEANSTNDNVMLIPPLTIQDGTHLSLMSVRNFTFAKSDTKVNLSGVKSEIDSLQAYLKVNPGKRLTITGYYSADELNNTSWPNLGIGRAEAIKKHYVDNGLSPDIFITEGTLKNDLIFSADSLRGGLNFTFSEIPAENSLAEAQKYTGLFKPLDLYFNTGSTKYIETKDNRKFIEEAKKYLSGNEGKKLLLTGHTDNTGSAENNERLSKLRADNAKSQLVAAGIPAEKLVTEAKGQREPKQPNNTENGRASNRRVSIVVK
jgi:OmpA-OmpF porin, OOP family